MVDYAQNVVKGHSNIKTKSRASSIAVGVAFPQLSFVLIVALLIYVLGYQNNTIEQVQHGINIKKTRLIQLKVQMDSLKAKQARILSSNSIISESKANNMETAKNIQIVY